MRNITQSSLRATAVIATVLALGSTPAFAQDASAPVIDAAPPAVVAVPDSAAPRITLPDPSSAPVSQSVSNPVVQPAPAPESAVTAPPSAPTRTAVTRAAKPAASAKASVKMAPVKTAPVKTAAASTPVSTASSPTPVKAATVTPDHSVAPLPARIVSDQAAFNSGSEVGKAPAPVAASKPVPVLPGDTGLIAGGLVVLLGIGGGAAMLGSRRRRAAEPVYAPVETVPPIVPAAVAVPATPVPAPVEAAPMPLYTAAPQIAGSVPHGEAREALLRQMVDAAPDAENPFTSGKARRRRARLILQAREQHELGREGRRPFDFRTYQGSVRTPATGDLPRTPETVLV